MDLASVSDVNCSKMLSNREKLYLLGFPTPLHVTDKLPLTSYPAVRNDYAIDST